MFSGSRKVSSKTTATPPQTSESMLLVPETTTTAEIVIPTGIPTQWFSLPHWRKRNVSQPTSPLRRCSGNSPPRLPHSPHSSRLLSLDKALPPTPSNEYQDPKNFGNSESLQPRASHFPTVQQDSKTGKLQNEPRSAPIAPSASRGLCISLASTSARVDANTFLHPSSSSEASNSSPQIRRTKSAHRLRAPNDAVTSEQLVERRRRGLSFGATNLFMNASDTTSKGKGKELEPSPNPSKPSPQPLSRRPSFWSKKKSPLPTKPPPQNDSALTVLPLTLVDVSPFAPEFTIEPFQSSNPNIKTTMTSPFQRLQSDNTAAKRTTPGSTTTSSTTSFEVVDAPLANQESSFMSRGYATPPLLHRLSFGVFSSPESSPIARPNLPNQYRSQSAPLLPFPSPKSSAQIPRPSKNGESPEGYVLRLKTHVSKAEVASVLASSSDTFYTRALKVYLDQFEFSGIPLDIALRKLLMEVGLPRETQQIDRVMEAFAFRYRHCNPNLFTSDDHPYILAFSLIMLHTDAFNPSNKRKMTKTDYIKNTKLPGIPNEVLDCFFDNIVFSPFIFIEDPEDIDKSSGLTVDLTGSMSTSASVPSAGMTTSFRTNKVDPYYLIMNDLLDPLRVDVNSFIPLANPFTYEGTNGPWDEERLHNIFLKAHSIDVELPLPFRSLFGYPGISTVSPEGSQETWRLKVIKAGVLNRKDDLLEGGKKALSRKWRTWSVILSGSHLLFCRDPTWVSASMPSLESGGPVSTKFRPDDIYSLKDGIAVYDRSYKKYNHTFRFVLPDGRHLLLQAANDSDLQQWISCINYTSTFKSTGVRMRPADENIQFGAASSTPHLHIIQKFNSQRRQSCAATLNEFTNMSVGQGQNKSVPLPSKTLPNVLTGSLPDSDNADQFNAIFKANLAIPMSPLDESSSRMQDCVLKSPILTSNNLGDLPRSQLILKKIRELDTKIAALQSHLKSDERHARNIAILTPFRKTTRSKLFIAIQNLAKPLMRMRLEMEKLKCYRTVLHSDFVSESRLRMPTKRLRVATDPVRLHRPNTAPTMTSPTCDDFGKQSSTVPSTPVSLSNSTSGSFHSARESAFDWPSDFVDDTPLHTSSKHGFHKPKASMPPSDTVPQFERENEDTLFETPLSSPRNDLKDRGHRDSTSDDDDQPEDWNKTRVAQRVSLIHVPSDFAIATRLRAVFEGNNDQG